MIFHAFSFPHFTWSQKIKLLSVYTIIEGLHCSQHSWIQRTVAALIMASPMITDTQPNLINCSAISFDNLVDSSTKLRGHGLDYQTLKRPSTRWLKSVRMQRLNRASKLVSYNTIPSKLTISSQFLQLFSVCNLPLLCASANLSLCHAIDLLF